MGRAKGQTAAVLAGGFDAVLGRRRGLTEEDREELHGDDDISAASNSPAFPPLSPREAQALCGELYVTDIMGNKSQDLDLRERLFAHLNTQTGSSNDFDSTPLLLGRLARQTCMAGLQANMQDRQLLLNRALGVPCGNAQVDESFYRVTEETQQEMSALLRDGKKLDFDEVKELSRQRCWDSTRGRIVKQIVEKGEEPFHELLDKKTYHRLYHLTRGLFTSGQLHKFVTPEQWDDILAAWDPATGKDGLAQAVAKDIEGNVAAADARAMKAMPMM